MIDLALLTEKRYLNPELESWYVKNILHEDQLIQDELNKLGVSSKRVVLIACSLIDLKLQRHHRLT